jgi:hypothetical protein
MMTGKKELRSSTGVVKDSNTIKTFESMDTLKPDDIVVIIHEDDYKKSFESMMKRINKMDEKVNEQSEFLNENIKDKKGFLGRFRRG